MALVSAPLFYGPKEFVGTPPGALSPEHFVQRVDEMATRHAWDDTRSAQMALSYLRGGARDYYTVALQTVMTPDAYATLMGSWERLKAHLRAKFFKLRTFADLSANWTRLSQGNQELPHEFAVRVLTAAGSFRALVNPPADWGTVPDMPAPVVALTAGWTATQQDDMKGYFRTLMRLAWSQGLERAVRMVAFATIINGTRPVALANKISNLLRENTSPNDILVFIEQESRHLANARSSGQAQNPHRPRGMNGNARQLNEVQQPGVAAMRQGSTRSGKCFLCGKEGHFKRNCPRNRGVAAMTDDGPPQDDALDQSDIQGRPDETDMGQDDARLFLESLSLI